MLGSDASPGVANTDDRAAILRHVGRENNLSTAWGIVQRVREQITHGAWEEGWVRVYESLSRAQNIDALFFRHSLVKFAHVFHLFADIEEFVMDTGLWAFGTR
jgi:hypothetical protein